MLTRTELKSGNARFDLTDNNGNNMALIESTINPGKELLIYVAGGNIVTLSREHCSELVTALFAFAMAGKLPTVNFWVGIAPQSDIVS